MLATNPDQRGKSFAVRHCEFFKPVSLRKSQWYWLRSAEKNLPYHHCNRLGSVQYNRIHGNVLFFFFKSSYLNGVDTILSHREDGNYIPPLTVWLYKVVFFENALLTPVLKKKILYLIILLSARGCSSGFHSGKRLRREDHSEVERTGADLRDYHPVWGRQRD